MMGVSRELAAAIVPQQATVERVTDDQLKVTISDQVAFDYKSTAIRPDFLPAIEHVADVLAKYDNSQVLVVGHSDAVGSDSYNRELSLARADAVRDAPAVYDRSQEHGGPADGARACAW